MPPVELTVEELKSAIKDVVEERIADEIRKLGRSPGVPSNPDVLLIPNSARQTAFLDENEQVPKGPSGFRGVREFLWVVAHSPGDGRLIPAGKAQTIGDPEAGGYLAPPEYTGRLITMGIEKGRIFPLCQIVPMKSNEQKTPVAASLDESSGLLYGGVKFAWVDEEGTKPEKEFKLQEITLRARTLAALCKSSNQLLEDSSPRAEQVINDIFSRSWAWSLDDVVLNGTGVGQPRGIIGAPCTYVQAKESGQSSATLVWPNIKKMYSHLWEDSHESAALRWLINPEGIEQILSLNQPVGTAGSSMIIASGEGVRPVPKTLLGIPIIWTSHCSALGAKGDVVLADLLNFVVGLRKGLSVAVSIHKYFETNHSLFRFEGRGDGQPIPASTIKTRTNFEVSPFVTLAART